MSLHIHGDELDEYLLRRIEDEEKLRVIEEHLLLCAECQQRLEDREHLIEGLRAYEADKDKPSD
jgi:hypothetical protein